MEYSGHWIFRNKLHVYPDLSYRPWPYHGITGQWQCLSQAHDLHGSVLVARIVECWIEMDDFELTLTVDDDFETSTLNGFAETI